MRFRFRLFGGLYRRLDDIDKRVQFFGEMNMAAADEFRTLLGRLNAATTDVAGDVRELKDRLSTGMTQAEVDEIKAGFEAAVVTLENTAREFPPEAPPEPPTEPS